MDKDTAISIKDLSKDFRLPHERRDSLKERVLSFKKISFDKFHALRDINVEIKRGEFFGIVGRNGSGKSTLLKIIGGIYQPTKGSVRINGTLTPFIELGIGFNPELTGRENVYLNGAILGLTRKQVQAKYQEIVDFAELHKFMDQKLKNYSSGMQVRLAFSIAIQAHNDILLIDEVLAVGDTNFQRKCYNVFKEIKKSGRTVVFVTHDMSAVQEFCDRAMMVEDSRIVTIGKPREVALRYEVANASNEQGATGKSSRPDNPPVRLESIRVRSQEKRTKNFTLDDDILVDIDLTVHTPTEIQVNAFLVRADGRYLAGFNTTGDLGKFCPPRGKHTVTCRYEKGQLAKGEYRINAALYTHNDWPKGDPPVLIDILDASYGVDTPRISLVEASHLQDGDFYIQGEWSTQMHGRNDSR
jgi:ABC-2 type transport system ATP-binding protein